MLDTTGPQRVDGEGTVALVQAAAAAGVEQFVLISSLGTGKVGSGWGQQAGSLCEGRTWGGQWVGPSTGKAGSVWAPASLCKGMTWEGQWEGQWEAQWERQWAGYVQAARATGNGWAAYTCGDARSREATEDLRDATSIV